MKLLAFGDSNVLTEHVLDNNDKLPKTTDRLVMRKIKSEFLHRDQLSNQILDDTQASKMWTDECCGEIGFIQEIRICPFGFTILCDLQV
jgi:hypothetical protein